MKKSLVCLMIMTFLFCLFGGCKDDKVEEIDYSKDLEGTYKGNLGIRVPGLGFNESHLNKIVLAGDGVNLMTLTLKDFSFTAGGTEVLLGNIVIKDIPVEEKNGTIYLMETSTTVRLNKPAVRQEGQLNEFTVTLESGTVKDGVLELNIKVTGVLEAGDIHATFNGNKMASDNEKTDAQLLSMLFGDESLIESQPVIEGLEITFVVKAGTTKEQLKALKPTLVVSDKASVVPASGAAVDFSSGPVVFTVTAEDGININKYTVGYTIASYTDALITKMTIDDPLVVEQPVVDGTNISFVLTEGTLPADLKNLIPVIQLSPGATVMPESGTAVDFSSAQPVKYTVTAENGSTNEYLVTYTIQKFTASEMTGITFNSNVVQQQPVRDGSNWSFYVDINATESELKNLVPQIKISEGATVSPASGTAVDFSSGPVRFTVTAENQSQSIYTVSLKRIGKYGFNSWENKTSDGVSRLEPSGDWSTSNGGVAAIKSMFPSIYNGVFAVTQESNAKEGAYAVKLTTLDTKGGVFGLVPKVTAGSVFLGTFETNKTAPLKSTKFGLPFYHKPLKITGYYKYKAGSDFYNNTTLDTKAKDAMAVTAILYEVSSYTETLDGTNIETSNTIVARGSFSSGDEKSEFTAFEVNMTYEKTYDPGKRYKLALIFSSSKDGAAYKGAPGSVLVVDDVSLIAE